MPKESLLSSMPKLILAVVLIVCIGTVMGLMGYALTKKQTRVEAPEVKTPDEIVEDETDDWQTYRNKLWGIEFKYPDDREISIKDLEGQINISIYTNKKLNYTNNLYFNPSAIDSENIVDFESLKNYLNNNNSDSDIIIFENKNGINFYKIITKTNTSHHVHYYTFYKGKKPFNIIKFHHRLDDHMKPENKELFKNIINNFNFIEIDEEMSEMFFQEKQINPECAGWYAANKYRGKNHLKNLSEIENITGKNGYSLFNDGEVNFYFPESWEVKIDKYDDSNNWYRIYYLKHSFFSMTADNIENFKNDYKMCIDRCFNDTGPASSFSWKAKSCSENYTEENLGKFLSGNYINYLSTGSLPPGGAGSFIYSKAYKDIIISASYSSEDFQYYPKAKEIRSNFSKSWEDLSEEEKKIISDEADYYEQEFYKIIKSFKTLK